MVRLIATGWLFALVMAAAWIGELAPALGPPKTQDGDSDSLVMASKTLAQVGRRRGDTYRMSGDDPGSCPPHQSEGPTFEPNQIDVASSGEDVLTMMTTELMRTNCLTDPTGRSCHGLQAEISVEGHSDDLPSSRRGGNQQLSYSRAQSVADWLSSAGFIIRSVDGVGSSQPAPAPSPDTRSAAERRHDDRRVSLQTWCPWP